MERKREIIIEKSEAGKKLLDWISDRYTYHDKREWKELITTSRVKINDHITTPETIILEGDLISYYPEPVTEPPIQTNYSVIYEDDDLLIINKPCDIPCHPGGIYFKNTLWYLLKQKYEYFALVNRLDRETSGIMLIAKNKESAKFYFNKMMQRRIKKEYLVLVHGKFPKSLDARGWIRKDSDSVIRKKRKFIKDVEAAPVTEIISPPDDKQFCHTTFEKVKRRKEVSLVKCNLITGRTHQIRATLCSLGYPVVGDKIYGVNEEFFFKFINDELTQKEWDQLILKNQALHSWKTEVPLLNGEIKTFTAEVPDYWPVKLNK